MIIFAIIEQPYNHLWGRQSYIHPLIHLHFFLHLPFTLFYSSRFLKFIHSPVFNRLISKSWGMLLVPSELLYSYFGYWPLLILIWDSLEGVLGENMRECWDSSPTHSCPASCACVPLWFNCFWSSVQQSVESLLFKFYVAVCVWLLLSDMCLRLHSAKLCQWKLPPLKLD